MCLSKDSQHIIIPLTWFIYQLFINYFDHILLYILPIIVSSLVSPILDLSAGVCSAVQ